LHMPMLRRLIKGPFATEEGRVGPILAERKHQKAGLIIVVSA
jgi:hypothetical protein